MCCFFRSFVRSSVHLNTLVVNLSRPHAACQILSSFVCASSLLAHSLPYYSWYENVHVDSVCPAVQWMRTIHLSSDHRMMMLLVMERLFSCVLVSLFLSGSVFLFLLFFLSFFFILNVINWWCLLILMTIMCVNSKFDLLLFPYYLQTSFLFDYKRRFFVFFWVIFLLNNSLGFQYRRCRDRV